MSKQEKPLVSIVTITLNIIKSGREAFLKQCIESIHNQTYKNIEHIIIDGASKDGTVNLLENYSKKGWIKYISEKDKGIYDAMNKGVKKAQGKYIAFINSDDFYHNKFGVEKSVNALEFSGATFSYAPVKLLDEKSGANSVQFPDISQVFYNIVPNHQTMLINRNIIISEGGFSTKYKCISDYDLTLRLCLKNYSSQYVNTDFVTYRIGGFSYDALQKGVIKEELLDIYFQNYNKEFNLTKEVTSQIVKNVFEPILYKLPLELVFKLKDLKHFDLEKYLKAVYSYNLSLEIDLKNLEEIKDEYTKITSSRSWKIANKLRKIYRKIIKN